MAVRMTRNAGMLSLAIYLILVGIVGIAAIPIPGVLLLNKTCSQLWNGLSAFHITLIMLFRLKLLLPMPV